MRLGCGFLWLWLRIIQRNESTENQLNGICMISWYFFVDWISYMNFTFSWANLSHPQNKKNVRASTFWSGMSHSQIYVCCEHLKVYHWAMLNLQDWPHKSHLHEISAAPPPHHHHRALQDKTLAGEVPPWEKKTGLLVSRLWFHFEDINLGIDQST